ncbi:mitogen-activated protein kinase kinase kinase 7-like [Drosophila nasuta]|uniref:mitogen-activated protein kinase kinase kinase 7-like n=1 Tax=Drosophila nasuta TaxID=42062 RepID=UPI00295EE4A7|nr:mitogen-activated protein kinase kinase kinase 7-like [Drosophila nasuta]
MLQCARGLEYLRRENVVHQDLKTKNLLLFNKYQILKICDFGFVMGIDESNLRSIESLFYTAPEIYIENNKFTEKSRVYSFGIILWEVMARKKPFENFEGMEPLNIRMEIIKGARPDVNYLIHEDYTILFNFIKEIIKRCWKESPVDRPTTIYLCEKFQDFVQYYMIFECKSTKKCCLM